MFYTNDSRSLIAKVIQNGSNPSEDQLSKRNDDIARSWGQYSPYFAVESAIPVNLPGNCEITFAQVLSRHGARDPTGQYRAKYRQRN